MIASRDCEKTQSFSQHSTTMAYLMQECSLFFWNSLASWKIESLRFNPAGCGRHDQNSFLGRRLSF